MPFFKRHILKHIGVALGALAMSAHPAHLAFADEAAEVSVKVESVAADVFVVNLVDKLRLLATDKTVDDKRVDTLQTVLAADMATSRLQRFLLSSEQRKGLSAAEIAEFDAVFPRYISHAFAGSIDQLVSRTIKVNDVIERRPGDFIVRSKLYADDGTARAGLDWRILESKGRKQLVDVIVDGLSFNVERRAQFTAILNKDGFPALIAHMKDVAGESKT